MAGESGAGAGPAPTEGLTGLRKLMNYLEDEAKLLSAENGNLKTTEQGHADFLLN